MPELYAAKQLEWDGLQFRTLTCSSRSWISPEQARLVNPSIHYKFCRSPAARGPEPNNTLMVVLFFQPAANSRLKAHTLLFVRDFLCCVGSHLLKWNPPGSLRQSVYSCKCHKTTLHTQEALHERLMEIAAGFELYLQPRLSPCIL